jgi:hypothetical protein
LRVTLAYPFQGHAPDDVVDVTAQEARLLLREGRARVAPPLSKPIPKPVHKPRTEYFTTPADSGKETEE